MASPADGPVAAAIGELRSQVLDLQLAGDPASVALAADLSALIAQHTGQPAPVAIPAVDDVDDIYDGDWEDGAEYEELPEPNRLVVTYRKHDPADGPLTDAELQAVLADAQASLELVGLGRIVVVDTVADLEDPAATVVHYEVLEPGTRPLAQIPLGVGAGIVAGVGRVDALTAVAYVEPVAG